MKRLLLISAPILSALLLFFPAAILHKKNVKGFEENKQRAETAEAKQNYIDNFATIPLSFEANQGQTASKVNFLSRGSGYNLFLAPTEAVLVLSKPADSKEKNKDLIGLIEKNRTVQSSRVGDVLRMKMKGANPSARVTGLDELETKSNYFIGNDPKKWRTNVTNYGKVRYEDVYPGVDMIYYGNQRRLEYDFVVAPGAEADKIKLSFEGTEKIEIDAEGNLLLSAPGGQLRQHKPNIYQEIGGKRLEIAGGYVLKGKNEAGFELGSYDESRPLIIDPTLSYSTYLGGSGSGIDSATDVAVDSAGNAYLTGQTAATDFPTSNPFQSANGGGVEDVFVTKLNKSGAGLVFSTFLGGGGDDIGNSIAVDSTGNVYVIGQTNSGNFPTLNAYQSANGGGQDAFVTKLDASGSTLLYSSYLGRSGTEQGFGIDVDSSGNAYLCGNTSSANFPILNGFQTSFSVNQEGFVTVLNTNLSGSSSLVYSTSLGGNGTLNQALALVLDSSGNTYVAGQTNSTNFPILNGLLATFGGGNQDGFVTKLNTNLSGLSSLLYSTYLGGNGVDTASDLAVDSAGNVYVTGTTRSSNFPIKNAFQSSRGGSPGIQDAYATKLDTNLSGSSSLVYSTYLGGSVDETALGIAINSAGEAYVAGQTNSTNYPILNAIQNTFGTGPNDAFVTKLNSSGNGLIYSTYLGGNGDEICRGIAVDSKGNAYIIGHTTSANYPITANAYQSALNGTFDVFVTKITEYTCPQPFTISQQPADAAACIGSSATFSVTAAGTGLTYQWFKNQVPIPGATGSSYTISSAGAGDEGSYDVTVTNICDEVVISTAATLTLNRPPAIMSQPTSQTVCIGSTATFLVNADGTGLTYQWQKNGVDIPGATSSTYTISSVTEGDAGSYTVVVNGTCSSITSSAATLTVKAPPTISTQPLSQTVCAGSNVSFNATAGGNPAPTVQWQVSADGTNFTDIAGATTNTLTFTAAVGDDGKMYRSQFSNGCSAVSSMAATLTINKAPINVSAGGPYIVNEGSAIPLTATGIDPEGGALTFAWDLNNDGSFETPDQSVSFLGLDTNALVKVRATDSCGNFTVASVAVNVSNVAPTVGAITAPAAPVQVNTLVNTNVNFTDPGVLDTHTAVWNWGDGNTSAGSVTEANGSGSTTGSHTYANSGVYTVEVTVTDKDGGSNESAFQFVVVFDPAGGFVTGGGWLNSPAGAYTADPSLTGKANFGFNSKYQHGATVPTGNTEFQFKAGNLNFKSTSYEYLVVAGSKAMFKGTGTINGQGSYTFLISAIDGKNTNDTDKFRIKIWAAGGVVYDNQLNAPDDAYPTTAIVGGDIVVH